MNDAAYRYYDDPLVTRYASRRMAERWGPHRKFRTWRMLWLALAEAEAELGLLADDGKTPRIRPQQLDELRRHLDDINFERADYWERKLRHDVMAHIHTLGEVAPSCREIIHLGATSCFVTDNTDLILIRESLTDLCEKLARVIDELAKFAFRWRSEPTLGYTHFQPAQLTTVGKRAALWLNDLITDLEEMEHRRDTLRLRGVKGTTGTQASFLALFRGDHAKVRELDNRVAQKMGFEAVYPVTGQTYSRKIDSMVLDSLGGLGQTCQKWGNDLRLLAHKQEIDEPFEADQVGSSAMAYKRNPMRAERLCSLGRLLSNAPPAAAQTAATQWLERTLDDSAGRRVYLPQAFLAADGCLKIALNLAKGITVNREVVARGVADVLPYMMTENLIMAAVAAGEDRQEAHEVIRLASHQTTAGIKAGTGRPADLVQMLQAQKMFDDIDIPALLDSSKLTGRAPEQVEEFIAEVVNPIRDRYEECLTGHTDDDKLSR